MRGVDKVGIFISLSILGLDQLTKWAVVRSMALHDSTHIIPGFLSFTYVRNKGAAFGLFSSAGPSVFSSLLSVFSVIAVGVLAVIWTKSRRAPGVFIIALSMIMGGAIGNLIDRLRMGEVIDFIDCYWRSFHWPAFNIADSAITVGVILLIIHLLFSPTSPSKE